MKSCTDAKLITGSVRMSLLRMSVPMVLGMLSLGMFNLVDTFFVGQLGTKQLSALTFIFPVVLIVNSIALGIGLGTSVLVSIAEGRSDRPAVRRLSTHALLLGVIITACTALAGELTIRPLFTWLGASETVLEYIHDYMVFWYPGVIAVVIPMAGNNILRALGDSTTPGFIMFFSMLINFLLDPLLIFGLGPFPELGISGAAIATIFSRSISAVAALYILGKRDQVIVLSKTVFHGVLISWRRIVHIGAPNALVKMIQPLAMGIITRQLADYGDDVVAGFGVGTRIEFFALAFMAAIASVTGPFIGQNIGAEKKKRVFSGIYTAETYALAIGAITATVLFIFAEQTAALFNSDPVVIATTVLYITIVPITYGLQGIIRICSAVLNVLKRPFLAAALVILHVVIFYLPLAFAAEYLLGVAGFFLAVAIATILTAAISHTATLSLLRRHF